MAIVKIAMIEKKKEILNYQIVLKVYLEEVNNGIYAY